MGGKMKKKKERKCLFFGMSHFPKEKGKKKEK